MWNRTVLIYTFMHPVMKLLIRPYMEPSSSAESGKSGVMTSLAVALKSGGGETTTWLIPEGHTECRWREPNQEAGRNQRWQSQEAEGPQPQRSQESFRTKSLVKCVKKQQNASAHYQCTYFGQTRVKNRKLNYKYKSKELWNVSSEMHINMNKTSQRHRETWGYKEKRARAKHIPWFAVFPDIHWILW